MGKRKKRSQITDEMNRRRPSPTRRLKQSKQGVKRKEED